MVKKAIQNPKNRKAKLGRKLAPATSSPISFKSKTLQVEKQSVSKDKGSIVTHRNLTFSELLSQSKHYSAHVRRDALMGIKDLLERHSTEDVIGSHVTALIDCFMDRISDEDAAVRHALRLAFKKLLTSWNQDSLGPCVEKVVLHCCAGMAHLDWSIRHDAARVLDALVTEHPPLVVPFAIAKIVPAYVHILRSSPPTLWIGHLLKESGSVPADDKGGQSSTNQNSKRGHHTSSSSSSSSSSKGASQETLLSCLHRLLSAVLGSIHTSSSSPSDDQSHHAMIFMQWAQGERNAMPLSVGEGPLRSLWHQGPSRAATGALKYSSRPNQHHQRDGGGEESLVSFVDRLFNTVVEFCSDILKSRDPGQAMDTPLLSAVNLCLQIAKLLLEHSVQLRGNAVDSGKSDGSSAPECSAYGTTVMRHLVAAFPFASPSKQNGHTHGHPQNERLAMSCNLLICDLVTLCLPPLQSPTSTSTSASASHPSPFGSISPQAIDLVHHFILDYLQSEGSAVRNEREMQAVLRIMHRLMWLCSDASHVTQPSPSAHLPATTCHLCAYSEALWTAFATWYRQCHPLSAAKRLSAQFIATSCPHPKRSSSVSLVIPPSVCLSLATELPKTLCQLQLRDPKSSAAVVRALLEIARRYSATDRLGENHDEEESSGGTNRLRTVMQSALVPLFRIPDASKQGRQVASSDRSGPFSMLPPHLQRAILDVVWHLCPLPPALADAVQKCVQDKEELVGDDAPWMAIAEQGIMQGA